MYTTSGTTLANTCTGIGFPFFIFCWILTNSYGFIINSDKIIKEDDEEDLTTTEPTEYVTYWWEGVLAVVLAILVVSGFIGLFMLARRSWRKTAEQTAAQTAGVEFVQYNRPFRRQELADWPRPQQTEFYNPRSSLQNGFMAQLAVGQHRRNRIGTQVPRQVTTHERSPRQIIRSASDTIDDPPAYDAAVQESGGTLPRKSPLYDASLDSDISIIESPPSYFMVQESLPNTQS